MGTVRAAPVLLEVQAPFEVVVADGAAPPLPLPKVPQLEAAVVVAAHVPVPVPVQASADSAHVLHPEGEGVVRRA